MPALKKKPEHAAPWLPVEYASKLQCVHALRAIAAGTATADQQKDFLKFLIEDVCHTYDLSFRPGNPEDTIFAEAKRFVGLTLVKLIKIKLGDKQKNTEQGE